MHCLCPGFGHGGRFGGSDNFRAPSDHQRGPRGKIESFCFLQDTFTTSAALAVVGRFSLVYKLVG